MSNTNSWFESMTTKPVQCANGNVLGSDPTGSDDSCSCNYSIWYVLAALALGYIIRGNR